MSYGFDEYKKNSISTARKEQVLLMLYQHAIKNCKKAIEAIETNELAAKGECIGRMQDIVVELNNSLDFSVSEEIASDLASLYDYIIFSSTRANIDIDKRPLESCLDILNTLYDGWSNAVKNLRHKKKSNASEALK